MPEHQRPPWHLAAAIAIVVGAASACDKPPTETAPVNVAQPPSPKPVVPATESFDREALLLAVMRAASARATGVDDLPAQRPLDGRQFEIRVRFGCQGPSNDKNTPGWTFDEQTRRLQIRAAPDLFLGEPLIRALFGDGVEEVEGFWLPRPWLLSAACPRREGVARSSAEESRAPDSPRVVKPPAEQPVPAPPPVIRVPRVGIAQVFTAADDRTRRRSGRAYEASRDLPQGEQPGNQGFNLVLSGRLRARPDGRVIHCRGDRADAPPDCVASADIDHVWIERPGSEAIIAEWRR